MLVYVFNIDLFEFSAASLEKGLLQLMAITWYMLAEFVGSSLTARGNAIMQLHIFAMLRS